jgi:hypothetical protein
MVSQSCPCRAYGGVDAYIHIFLTLALAGGKWLASRPGRFTPEERAQGTHCTGGSVDPRGGLDMEERKLRPLGRPAPYPDYYMLLMRRLNCGFRVVPVLQTSRVLIFISTPFSLLSTRLMCLFYAMHV